MTINDLYNLNDTIVAVSTPRGNGGIGIVRLSGHKAIEIAIILSKKKKIKIGINYASFFCKDGFLIDRGLLLFFKSPKSFTGEDLLEFHIHGNDIILDSLVIRCIELGARTANNGEFSFRSYFNGKIDLIQAEAINSIIKSSYLSSNKFIFKSLSGNFSNIISSILSNINKLYVSLEASIEFPDHISFDFDIFYSSFLKIYDDFSTFFNKLSGEDFYSKPLNVVLLGDVNVGKSSFFNLLLNSNRSIVSDIPGTTRDFIDSSFFLNGIKIKLVDTAGLNFSSNDFLEKMGIQKTYEQISLANILVFVCDVTSDVDLFKNDVFLDVCSKAIFKLKIIVIRNKIDLLNLSKKVINHDNYVEIFLSVKNNYGIDLFIDELSSVYKKFNDNFFFVNKRQFDLLNNINFIFNDLLSDELKPLEIYSSSIYNIIVIFNELLGLNYKENILTNIFSNFCVGK